MNDVNNIVQKYSRTQIYGVTVIMFGHETVMLKIVCKLFKDMCKCTVLRYSRKSCDSYMGKKIQFGCERSLSTESDNLWSQAIGVFCTDCMHAHWQGLTSRQTALGNRLAMYKTRKEIK